VTPVKEEEPSADGVAGAGELSNQVPSPFYGRIPEEGPK